MVALCCYCAGLAPDAGSYQSQETADRSVFRTSTDLVRLDVSVVDASGAPVPDLRVSDFDVRQDGKPQRLLFAEFRGPESSQPDRNTPANSLGSQSADRRVVIIVDDLRMSLDSVVRIREEIISALLENRGAHDQAMVVGTRYGGGRTVAFTNDPAVIREQVQTLRWEAATRNELPDPDERRRHCLTVEPSDDALDVEFGGGPLRFVASALAELRSHPGRKVILLLADGISDMCREYRWSFDERVRRLSDIAGRSSTVIYALQTRPFSSGVRMPDRRAGAGDVSGRLDVAGVHNEVSERMKKLAEPTGGYARRSNDVAALVASALKDQDSYYVLAYVPPPGTFMSGNPRYRKLQVRVSRRGATVRTRGGFYSVDDATLFLK